MEQWIKVSDRLPEEGVLVRVKKGGKVLVAWRHDNDWYEVGLVRSAGVEGSGWYPGIFYTGPTTEWLPLEPQPSTTEEKAMRMVKESELVYISCDPAQKCYFGGRMEALHELLDGATPSGNEEEEGK